MTSGSNFFTIIIPCKNRATYLHHTLRTCMMQNYDALEVIVSDDGSTDNTREIVEHASHLDSRIRYIKPCSGFGMLNNFEFALEQVKPGFVIALGGDDGLLPDGIQGMSDTLRATGMDLLAWPAPTYYYPNVIGDKAQLTICRDKGIRIVKSDEFLSRQAKELRYSSDRESPMFYIKGVASTKLIDKVKARTSSGRFYSCPTPDGYSGIVLAGEVDCYAYSGKPFSIFGASPDSHGLTYLSNKQNAKKISEEFFQSVSSTPMHRELASQPYSPLITLMTVDYLLTAKDLPGWHGSFPSIDFRQVLIMAIKELSSGMYGNERVSRELGILKVIAEKHGLGEFFRKKISLTNCYQQRSPFTGNGINTNKFYFDGNAYHIDNIFDAAYAVKYLYQFYTEMNLASLFNVVFRSIVYRLKAMKHGNPFPPESEWG